MRFVAALTLCTLASYVAAAAQPHEGGSAVILVYHRFGPVAADEMTVTTSVFAWQLKYLRDNGYHIVPLRDVVDFVAGRRGLPDRAVAITADDGHRTVFTDMLPLIMRYQVPVTLFIYPSAISNAPYTMTWEQLAELKATGRFKIESHTYWHPNFRIDKRRLSPDSYQREVTMQLGKSRQVLERRLGTKVDLLAWPFGIYDAELMIAAIREGYVAAFSIDRRNVSPHENPMAIPRYIVTNHDQGKAFEMLVAGKSAETGSAPFSHSSQD